MMRRSLAFALLAWTATAAAAPAATSDTDAQKASVKAIRDVGVAMFSWLTDQVGAAAAAAPASAPQAAQPTHLAVADYPPITLDEVRKLLVPKYIAEIPGVDGWGHALEFRINVKNPKAEKVFSVRSPGRDGKFEGDVYPIGAFDRDAFDRDLVWADGYFVTWPGK